MVGISVVKLAEYGALANWRRVSVTSATAGRKALQASTRFAYNGKSTNLSETRIMDRFMQAAIAEAQQGLAEGGIPIGSVIVHQGRIIGRGHNRRVQRGSAILHGEMDAFENAGRQPATVYREAVLYTTLSPCSMCCGAILLYGIPRVVIGENTTFMGDEALLRSRGVTVEVLQDASCIRLMQDFIAAQPQLWNEDIGVD